MNQKVVAEHSSARAWIYEMRCDSRHAAPSLAAQATLAVPESLHSFVAVPTVVLHVIAVQVTSSSNDPHL